MKGASWLVFESDPLLVDDREDLIALLRLKFGFVEGEIIESIYQIDDFHTLQRLILVAANAPHFSVFLNQLEQEVS